MRTGCRAGWARGGVRFRGIETRALARLVSATQDLFSERQALYYTISKYGIYEHNSSFDSICMSL